MTMVFFQGPRGDAAANLQSHALHADSDQSDICAYLAVMILLGGLGSTRFSDGGALIRSPLFAWCR